MAVLSFTQPPSTPTKGSKVKHLNFAITKTIVNIFAEILHVGKAAIDMKHIKWDFSLKAWVRATMVDLGVWAEAKINLFQNMVIKAGDFCSNMVANILPTYTPLTQWWGQKVKPYTFVKVVVLHIKLKGIEHRAP